MVQRPQVGVPDPAQQLPERGVAGGVGAQHHRGHEEAHQVVERRVEAARGGRSYRDVGARTQPGEQRGQRGVQHHERAGAALGGERPHGRGERGRQRQRHRAAVVREHRGPRPGGGQRQLLRCAGQLGGPELRLGVAAVGEQQVPLPAGVVGVTHRQRRPARRLARAARGRPRPGRAAAGAATTRHRRCGAAPAAASGAGLRSRTGWPAAAVRWPGRTAGGSPRPPADRLPAHRPRLRPRPRRGRGPARPARSARRRAAPCAAARAGPPRPVTPPRARRGPAHRPGRPAAGCGRWRRWAASARPPTDRVGPRTAAPARSLGAPAAPPPRPRADRPSRPPSVPRRSTGC